MVFKTNIRAPRGSELSCKGWTQEAAMRMLMNNLDPALRRLSNGCRMLVRPSVRSCAMAAAVYVFNQFRSWFISGNRGAVISAAK